MRTDEEKRQRAGEAQRLLDEPLLTEVLNALHTWALEELLAVDPDMDTEIKNLVMVERLRAVRWIRDGLQAIVNESPNTKQPKFGVV